MLQGRWGGGRGAGGREGEEKGGRHKDFKFRTFIGSFQVKSWQ